MIKRAQIHVCARNVLNVRFDMIGPMKLESREAGFIEGHKTVNMVELLTVKCLEQGTNNSKFFMRDAEVFGEVLESHSVKGASVLEHFLFPVSFFRISSSTQWAHIEREHVQGWGINKNSLNKPINDSPKIHIITRH